MGFKILGFARNPQYAPARAHLFPFPVRINPPSSASVAARPLVLHHELLQELLALPLPVAALEGKKENLLQISTLKLHLNGKYGSDRCAAVVFNAFRDPATYRVTRQDTTKEVGGN